LTRKQVSVKDEWHHFYHAKWKETQFSTESRLQDEVQSVEEIHYTAGTPFNARVLLKYTF
jgi:hypothetical protein